MLLREAPLPQDILKIGAGGINQIWRNAKVRAAGIKRAQTLVEAAQNSVGLEAGEAARLEIWVLVNDYILKAEQLKRLDEYLEEKVKEFINTNGIKKKFFANLLGISVAKLSAMLQGKRKMKADELIIFSEYFNLKSDFFADVNYLQECN